MQSKLQSDYTVSSNWQMKWQCFSLMDNTSLSLYLMASRLDNAAKVNDLEVALWAFKNVQNINGSTIKTFNSRTSINRLVNLKFHFVVIAAVGITSIEYFLTVFISSFIKIFEKSWKWFEFIHYLFLVNNVEMKKLMI